MDNRNEVGMYTREMSAYLHLATKEELDRYGINESWFNAPDQYACAFLDHDGTVRFRKNASYFLNEDLDEDPNPWLRVSTVLIGKTKPDAYPVRETVNIGNYYAVAPDRDTLVVYSTFPELKEDIDHSDMEHSPIYLDHEWEEYAQMAEQSIIENGAPLVKTPLPISLDAKKQYRLSDYDYNKGHAFNEIITGETGCGKTYKAVHDEMDAGRKFAYIAPCRQLVYETYRNYGDCTKDALSSGEIKINADGQGNFYGVFESASPEQLRKGGYDTLIIDEAHFVKDQNRGNNLLTLIAECRKHDINLKLLTATQNFQLNNFPPRIPRP